MKKYILVITFSFICLTSFEQVLQTYISSKYIIDPEITQQLKKYPYADTGILRNSMNIEVTWDGKPFFNQQNLACYTYSSLSNDTIYITGFMRGQVGWGFQLVIFGDSCLVGAFALSDEKLYKSNISDSIPLSFIELPSITQKLELSRKPTFSEGERIEGFVQLKSKDFYYIVNQSRRQSNIIITAFFKTSMLKSKAYYGQLLTE